MNENQVTVKEEKEVLFQVNGEDVRLTPGMVKKFLVKGNGNVTDREVVMFMNLCKFNKLNPFLGDAHLVKFGNSDANMITSKDAFMKRAEAHASYNGFKAGIIVLTEDKQVVEREGCFKLKTEELVGGWAEVYREDRKEPIVMKVSLDEYDKKQSTWKEKPSTMIRKVAIVQAFREAFPDNTTGLYVDEEMPTQKESSVYEQQQETATEEFKMQQHEEKKDEVIDVEVTEEQSPTSTDIDEDCPC